MPAAWVGLWVGVGLNLDRLERWRYRRVTRLVDRYGTPMDTTGFGDVGW